MTELINNKSSRAWLWLAVILFTLSFGTGLLVGRAWNIQKQITGDKGQVEIAKVLNLYSKSHSDKVKFDQFWDVWDKIKEKYVNQPVDDAQLFYGALQGLVSGLDDPYSVYFPPEKAEEFAKELSGELEGIGAEVGLKEKQLMIIAPLPNSPAEKAGLRPGDKIYAINKVETANMTVDEAVSKIRGPKGTSVTLTVSHDGLDKVQEITIIRDKINVPTVIWEMKPNNVAYLRVAYFNENTWDEFDKAVNKIVLKTPKGLILDLRSDPGGFLETSIKVASEWIREGVIVKEKFSQTSQNKENVYQASGRHRLIGIKTVVLVDEGTASASEIVAGALQDYGVGKLVGMKTYGKGSVQDFEALPDGSALKITIANWYTPKDRQINKQGIMPDVVLDKMLEELKDKNGNITYKDLGLEKALELLK